MRHGPGSLLLLAAFDEQSSERKELRRRLLYGERHRRIGMDRLREPTRERSCLDREGAFVDQLAGAVADNGGADEAAATDPPQEPPRRSHERDEPLGPVADPRPIDPLHWKGDDADVSDRCSHSRELGIREDDLGHRVLVETGPPAGGVQARDRSLVCRDVGVEPAAVHVPRSENVLHRRTAPLVDRDEAVTQRDPCLFEAEAVDVCPPPRRNEERVAFDRPVRVFEENPA